MALVGISLGSNLGDRLANLDVAVASLTALRSSNHFLASPVYETAPVDCLPGAPRFLNAVVELETTLEPLDLLAKTQAIEKSLGREKTTEINAPRPVDLDLLYYDSLILNLETLTLPHPRMTEREFVLRPLRDIRPDLVSADQLALVSDDENAVRPVLDNDEPVFLSTAQVLGGSNEPR